MPSDTLSLPSPVREEEKDKAGVEADEMEGALVVLLLRSLSTTVCKRAVALLMEGVDFFFVNMNVDGEGDRRAIGEGIVDGQVESLKLRAVGRPALSLKVVDSETAAAQKEKREKRAVFGVSGVRLTRDSHTLRLHS